MGRTFRTFAQGPYPVHLLIVIAAVSGCGEDPPPNRATTDWGKPIPAYVEPIWSPDGSRIMFNHTPLESIYLDGSEYRYVFAESLSGFWTIDADGKNQRRVSTRFLEDPAWAPNGEWIAFDEKADIWRVAVSQSGLDTTDFQQLTFQGFYFGPAWNPSSTTLVFYRPSGPIVTGLYRVNAGGGAPEHFGQNYWAYPNWSPDGTKIACVGPNENETYVGLTDSTGSGVTWIRSGMAPAWPRWSPDGSRIAFLDRDPATQVNHLWVMNPDGAELRKASPHAVGNGFSWAPDGERIVYARFSFTEHSYENGTLWIVNILDGSLRQLTFNEAH